jgi:hypothetical protein
MLRNGLEPVKNVHENGHATVRNVERLGTFEPERGNALELMVENVHATSLLILFKIERITVEKA